MRSAKVPVSWPTHSTFIFEVGEVSIHGASAVTRVSWMSWNTGRISCGNGISISLDKQQPMSFAGGRLHPPGADHLCGGGSGQEGNQFVGPGPLFCGGGDSG